jgi:hypothetical protein
MIFLLICSCQWFGTTASWGAGGEDNGDAPQIKGARYFSFDELKKCTNNFSETHAIGSGGYGKVNNYRA